MQKFSVKGMSCAACSARVEKAVSALDGVESCAVNLLAETMIVEGSASSQDIIAAVVKAGYSAFAEDSNKTQKKTKTDDKDSQTKALKNRLISSLVFLLVLMYVSMGHNMFGFPLPSVLAENPVAIGILQMILSAIVMVINQKFFISGFRAILHRSPNMDTLVALGSSASFVFSVYNLFAMTTAFIQGDSGAVNGYLHSFYFESAAMILTLITVGKLLEAVSKGRTTDALEKLMELSPQTAVVIKNGIETEVDISDVSKGDMFVLRPGSAVPVDGVVIDGTGVVDESALTGESVPADKSAGDKVSSGTFNKSGYLRCEATRVGEDTTLSQIIRMVSDASATKAPIARIADKVSGVFVPVVMVIAAVTFAVWMLCGETAGYSLARAVSVLVISCPCALGLATPVAIMVGNGVGAKNGILFKTAASLEQAGKIDTVILDKTGTITSGKPEVTDVICADGTDAKELLRIAYSLEAKSEHPFAKAIIAKGDELGIVADETTSFESGKGGGVSAITDSVTVAGGNSEYISSFCTLDHKLRETATKLAQEGKTPLFFSYDSKACGIIAVADSVKPDSAQAIRELEDMSVKVVMLTGDNERTARAIAEKVGIKEVIAGVLPIDKESTVRKFMEQGKVAMVGDGINDSPALTAADVGIAIGAGTDIAVEAADIVLINSRLTDVSAAIKLGRATLRNIKQNLFWAFIYNIIGIPLAAGVLIPLFGITLSPMIGAAAMSMSSFCVVTNALRLNLAKIRNTDNDEEKETIVKEKTIMEKTVRIEGMMCPHCEARVKSCFEAMEEVDAAVVSHVSGTAVLTLNAELPDEKIISVIEAQGYKVIVD